MVAREGSCGVPDQVRTKQDVLSVLREKWGGLRALGVQRVGLFGSFVRGEAGADSDVDLLVEFEPGKKTFDNFVAVSCLLEVAFQRKVELLTPQSLSPYIGPHVLAEVEYVVFAA